MERPTSGAEAPVDGETKAGGSSASSAASASSASTPSSIARGRVLGARAAALLAAAVVVIAAILCFARLGDHALWDDEANTALVGQAVFATGDTGARVGANVVAYRNGGELTGDRVRYLSPLQYFMAAPFVGLAPGSSFAARLPFALSGLAAVGLIAHRLRRRADAGTWAVTAIALLANVPLFLYARQARYYAPAMLATVIVGDAWLRRAEGRRALIVLSAGLIACFASTYLGFAALAAALLVDLLVFGRSEPRPTARDVATVLIPLCLVAAPIAWIWNPLGHTVVPHGNRSWIADRLTLLWWNLRDADRCELGVGPLLLLAPLVGLWRRDRWLLRGSLALFVYVAAIACVSPQPVVITTEADVRYLAALIPLAALVGARTLLLAFGVGEAAEVAPVERSVLVGPAGPQAALRPEPSTWAKVRLPLVIAAAALAFGTNLLELAWVSGASSPFAPRIKTPLRSTIASFLRELASPLPDPYRAAAGWIDANVPAGASVWVVPEWMMYPLMFHAPRAVYAWQLSAPVPAALADLPPVHVRGEIAPDFVVVFGPFAQAARAATSKAAYVPAAQLEVYWKETYRPELLWHAFRPIEGFDPKREGITILQRAP